MACAAGDCPGRSGVDLVLGERDEEGGQVAFEVEPFLVIECGAGEGPARGFMGLVHEPEEVVAIVGDACRLQLVWLIRERAAADFLVPDELSVYLVGLACQVQGDVGAVRLIETEEVRELPGPVRLDNPLVVAGETVPEILFRLVPAEGGGRSFAGGRAEGLESWEIGHQGSCSQAGFSSIVSNSMPLRPHASCYWWVLSGASDAVR